MASYRTGLLRAGTALTVAAALIVPGAPAQADPGVGSVQVVDGTRIVVISGSGLPNGVSVRRSELVVTIDDRYDMVPGPGCEPILSNDSTWFNCTTTSPATRVEVTTGDGNDYVVNDSDVTVRADGGDGDDTLYGGPVGDRLDGGDGNDVLLGRGDSDQLFGGAGTDMIYGGDGGDELDGGDGGDYLYGQAENDDVQGGAGDDSIEGGDSDDAVSGDAGDDVLYGGTGYDVMHGGPGNDTLRGGTGTDFLFGGANDDQIYGDEHIDYLWGNGTDQGDRDTELDLIDGGESDTNRCHAGALAQLVNCG
jgi:Ca2+-binding RTX toxin-like protein